MKNEKKKKRKSVNDGVSPLVVTHLMIAKLPINIDIWWITYTHSY